MQRARPLQIGVVGGNTVGAGLYREAVEVGRLLARARVLIFCGGMGGAMEAVCKGAAEEGGTTIGLLPDDTTARANAFVTVPIATGLGFARNYIIVHNSQALIAIGGAEGTLNEMAAALNLGRTVVSLRSWPLDTLGMLRRGTLLNANDAAQAVRLALGAAAKADTAGQGPKRARTRGPPVRKV